MLEITSFGATVLVDGRQLTSAVDRRAEASMQARLVPTDAEEVWIYGVGLGDLVIEFLSRPKIKKVHVCILNIELYRRLNPLVRASEDPRLVIHLPGEETSVKTPYAFSPGELRHTDAEALSLRDQLIAINNLPYNDKMFSVLADVWAKQRESNKPFLLKDDHVERFYSKPRGATEAIVIAGGPTATAQLPWIKQRKDATIIAVGRALIPLLAADIIPDVVVMIDRGPGYGAPLFPTEADPRLQSTFLAYIEDIETVILEKWPGPRVWMREGDLFMGGSVLHTAADLATRMGARTVHLVGADLCFPRGQSHLEGATGDSYQTNENSWRTKNGLDQWVYTQESMMQYHRAMEALIAERPDVRWLKYGREGVPLRGAEWV